MDHHHHSHDSGSSLGTAFFLNFGFTILELIGGLWTNSVAITADALHDLGDTISLGVAWFLGRYAQKETDQDYSYGYRRYSLLGALVNTLILIGGGLFVLSEAVPRLLAPERANAAGMIGLAIVGVIVNGLAVWRVKGGQSLNTQVVTWHLLEDVLGWVAVLIVSIVLLFTDWYILDPILSILITLYVLYNVIGNLRKTLAIFLQAVPESIDISDIQRRLAAIEPVQSTHHTHVWSLDGEQHVLTTHLVVPDGATKEVVLAVKRRVIEITNDHNFAHVTIEIEYESEDCRLKE